MDPIARALRLVEDDDRFGTAREAGESFARVADVLLRAGRSCGASCPALLEASAYAQLVAVEILTCTRPGIHDARRTVRDHLAALAATPDSARRPEVPALPDCPDPR